MAIPDETFHELADDQLGASIVPRRYRHEGGGQHGDAHRRLPCCYQPPKPDARSVASGSRGGEDCAPPQALSRRITASAYSSVLADPPRSGVRVSPEWIWASTALRMRSATSDCLTWSRSTQPARTMAA